MRIEGAGEALETWILEDETQAQFGLLVQGADRALFQDYGHSAGQWMRVWVPHKSGRVYLVTIALLSEGQKEGVP